MPRQINWTRDQLLPALHLYMQIPFGRLDARNPKIIQLAGWIGRTPNAVALKLVNFASLDPEVQSRGRKGMGNSSSLDAALWAELKHDWAGVARQATEAYEKLALTHDLPAAIDVIDEVPEIAEGKTRSAVVQVRVNQVRFRRAILASYDATCCISGLRHEKLVIASHIVPWSLDKANRLNPQNGLCLSALHDRAYDQGLLTVMPDYTVRVDRKLVRNSADPFLSKAILSFDRQQIRLPKGFKPNPAFLESHARRFGYIKTQV